MGWDAAIISIGPVRAADSLRREMANTGVTTVESFEVQPLPKSQRPNVSGDIAIVGIAGRLPGGETLEEIWKNLEEGKDLHKKVSVHWHKCFQALSFVRYQKIGSMWTLTVIHPGRSKIRL